MKLIRIKYTKSECISKIKEIAKELSIKTVVENKKDHTIIKLINKEQPQEGMIRVYDSKKRARTLDGSQKNKILNSKVLEVFKERYCNNEESTVISKQAIYDVSSYNFDDIRKVIEDEAKVNDYIIEDKDSHLDSIYYMISIRDKKYYDKVTITQYENTGKLLLQGKTWNVWDNLCNAIEKKLNTPVTEIILRYMGKSDENEEKITDIVTDSLTIKATQKIHARMGNSFDFLYEHDKKLLISSQAMLDAGIDYGDYYCYVAPALRVIEGYLKKVLIDLGICTETEIIELKTNGKPKFRFNTVFDGTKQLHKKHKDKLNNYNSTVEEKEKALLLIYDKFSWLRSPYKHDSPPPIYSVDSYDDAEAIFDEIIGMINTTYVTLFGE